MLTVARSDTIDPVLRARLRTLRARDRRVLTNAALLGYRFDAATLAAMLACDIDDVVGSLERARDADLIVEEPAYSPHLRFTHAFVRAAFLEGLAPEAARRLHRKIVRALEKLPDVDRHVDRLAYHAREGRLLIESLIYSERAGDTATVACAFVDAARYYDWALAAAVGPTSRARLLFKRSSLVRAR